MSEVYLHSNPAWVQVAALATCTYFRDLDSNRKSERRMIEECALSLLRDLDKGKLFGGLGSYASLWGLTKTTLQRSYLLHITQTAWEWASSYGRQPTRGVAQNYQRLVTWKHAFSPNSQRDATRQRVEGVAAELPPEEVTPTSSDELLVDHQRTDCGPPADRSGANGANQRGSPDHQRTDCGPPADRHTKTSSSSSHPTPPPTAREVEIYFDEKGLPDALHQARSFCDYWEARDWTASSRNGPVRITATDFKRRAATWLKKAREYHDSKPKNQPNGQLGRGPARPSGNPSRGRSQPPRRGAW